MILEGIAEGAPDPVFGLQGAYLADNRPEKMTLIVGTYKDSHLKSALLSSVKRAKERLAVLDTLADYLPIDGLAEFGQLVGALCFGEKSWQEIHSRVFAAQAIGGTGAIRIGAEFCAQEVGRHVAIPQPTWANHRSIFERAGFSVQTVPYYNSSIHSFDREAYFAALESLPKKTILLLHAACHNPTGSDPSMADWERISDLCKAGSFLPFFDFAYQGFGEGVEKDGKVLRLFLERGHEFLVAYSCSKNFGLYCQRVGALFTVSGSSSVKVRVGSQIKRIIRANYSSPPAHGAMIVAEILKNRELRAEWMNDVDGMRHRISAMRDRLVKTLRDKSSSSRFDFIKNHKGMFSYLDLDKSETSRLIEEFAIYTLDSGRINIAGLNEQNIDYFVERLLKVCGE